MSAYVIRSGDTLGSIAARFHTSVGALQRANGIANPNLIYAGRRLTIPDRYDALARPPVVLQTPAPGVRTYTVRSGDTLGAIAARYHTSVSALASLNGLANPNLIYVGQHLRLGGSGPGPVGGPPPVQGPPPSTSGGVSLNQLERIMPSLPDWKARQYLPYLNAAMHEAGITTPRRQAAFLAQLAHESGELRWMEELASGAAYEGRRDLGNIYPGDGVRYKGRGPIQLTGRANYAAASAALGIDLVNHPTRAADPDVGFRVAAWFWRTHGLNQLADAGNFDEITRRINGGYNGKASRDAYYARARAVLGA